MGEQTIDTVMTGETDCNTIIDERTDRNTFMMEGIDCNTSYSIRVVYTMPHGLCDADPLN